MAALTQKRRGFTSAQWRDLRTGLFFISPWLLGFFLWTFYPLFSSLYYSFHRYDLLRPAVWVGLKNYVEIFTKDPTFWQVAYNTVYFVGFGIPLGVIGAFLMATLLNTEIKGRSVFRTIASRLGKKIVYLPIGQLSPVSLKRIRVFHVLSGHHLRQIAKDYIW